MRIRALLIWLTCACLLVSCGATKKPDSVRKYCVLTTMPMQTGPQLRAIHDRAMKLFKERKPYRKNDANRRVITAATSLTATSAVAALQAENPKLFPGQPKGLSIDIVMAELMAACHALPKSEK